MPSILSASIFISAPSLLRDDGADINMLADRMDGILSRGLNLGLESQDIIAMFKDRLEKFIKTRQGGRRKKTEFVLETQGLNGCCGDKLASGITSI